VLREFGIVVPRGIAAFSVDEAVKAAQDLGSPVVVVKAQIHAGGRGKAGGVKVVKTIDEVRTESKRILGSVLRFHRTRRHSGSLGRGTPGQPTKLVTSQTRPSRAAAKKVRACQLLPREKQKFVLQFLDTPTVLESNQQQT
jgi:succinyl-CoA synthetase beta subunit